MSDVQPLIALLEIMLNLSTPRKSAVKPGGHPENIFVDLTEEEKEGFECSICYQILKDPRMCINNHKYCYPCIFVWTTSGYAENHSRCPVCRVRMPDSYIRCRELAERIGLKKVKCLVRSCKWKGPLKSLGTHQHTTYTETGLPYRPSNREAQMFRENDIPQITDAVSSDPDAVPSNYIVRDVVETTSSNGRLLIRPTEETNNVTSQGRLLSRSTEQRAPSGLGHTRSIARRNIRVAASSDNATGSLSTPRTPHPPSVPRPSGSQTRRGPTLPNIVGHSQPSRQPTTPARNNATSTSRNTISATRNSSSNTDNRPQGTTTASRLRARNRVEQENPGNINIRERLRESRSRLDSLMTTFSSEVDRGRNDIAAFQDQRERRRQEQLDEVRDLGRRLGQVATELRQLLDTRRQLRDDIEETISEL
ncbi:uncharacterized protein LOC110449832 [Mizuhopecten yessoensis]|uniref:E3 ubiquitin-protein ligase RMA1H1 n=1 Tax=Mizuhopecten yessoensis TaxID=6573 RepID=A0A210R593_MIZYE|nr:uncharacterized protein LOC110449832 [Mizuhopecten yessoensis]OWF56227.1 E3 ubiquitin-protein ligase RMA1H1 [Mizuhopecten yessoensis]